MPANRRYPAGVLSLIVGLLALLGVSLAPVPVVWADAAQQPILTAGAVVSLQGTPHLWIADDEETLHWVGDTRAWPNGRSTGSTGRKSPYPSFKTCGAAILGSRPGC